MLQSEQSSGSSVDLHRLKFADTTRSGIVKKMHEYLEHAAECREIARTALPQHRQQLEHMATTWEQLAEARKRHLKKQGKSAQDEMLADDDA